MQLLAGVTIQVLSHSVSFIDTDEPRLQNGPRLESLFSHCWPLVCFSFQHEGKTTTFPMLLDPLAKWWRKWNKSCVCLPEPAKAPHWQRSTVMWTENEAISRARTLWPSPKGACAGSQVRICCLNKGCRQHPGVSMFFPLSGNQTGNPIRNASNWPRSSGQTKRFEWEGWQSCDRVVFMLTLTFDKWKSTLNG